MKLLIKDTPNKEEHSFQSHANTFVYNSTSERSPLYGLHVLYTDSTVHVYTCSHVDSNSVWPEKVECPVDWESVEDNVSEKWTLCELEWSEESHAPNHYRGNEHPSTWVQITSLSRQCLHIIVKGVFPREKELVLPKISKIYDYSWCNKQWLPPMNNTHTIYIYIYCIFYDDEIPNRESTVRHIPTHFGKCLCK